MTTTNFAQLKLFKQFWLFVLSLLIETSFTLANSSGKVQAQQIQTFNSPTIEGRSVDACIDWANGRDGCGEDSVKIVAQEFCRAQGMSVANYGTTWLNSADSRPVVKLTNTPGHFVWQKKQGGRFFSVIRCR